MRNEVEGGRSSEVGGELAGTPEMFQGPAEVGRWETGGCPLLRGGHRKEDKGEREEEPRMRAEGNLMRSYLVVLGLGGGPGLKQKGRGKVGCQGGTEDMPGEGTARAQPWSGM